ncbi:MAG: alpha/beta fold hydrolase [Acidobacteria bacterium]|nr:MAG: alpha/beta fold hydrolase [Acidobacteriota bacterium]REK11289.1 MAG: alpha/beta fold hydrolase [Acidobacteriota bacterium]
MNDRIRFTGSSGEQLVGRIDAPASTPRAWALFAHCFTCSKDLRAARNVSRALAERGFAVLRFDFTGLGESEGDFADTTFRSNVDDLVAAADWLRAEHSAPTVLVGHSLGGAAVLVAAERIPEARAVATLGAPSDTEHLRSGLLAPAVEAGPLGDGERRQVTLAGRSFEVGKELLDDLAEDHLGPRLARLRRALLVMHSPVDEIVGVDHARRLYEAAKHPKSFVSLDDADHLLTRAEDARYAADVLAAWASRYLEETADAAADSDTAPAEGTVRIVGRGEDFLTHVHTAEHTLIADEPTSVPKGTDLGPNPYELLLAALGACTSMTVGMYARRKQWPLEGIELTLTHGRVHAEDCEECESAEGQVDRIEVVLTLHGDLDADQRQRLLEISQRCPVHKTLTTETRVTTELAD